MNLKSVVAGIVTGTVLASVATLLYTPQSGKVVQQNVRRSIDEVKNNYQSATNLSTQLKNQVVSTSKEGASTLKIVSGEIKNSVEQWKEDVHPSLQKLEKDIEQLRNTVENFR
ncbi:YtxH domain-containing protein [Bacillus alkalicellulosilyticus]|uniref:YtxH domain-containing protein n=1 Tax=Alkalihalobacterium alkalicellulosilyticum TaxID=1912214 RepID=UPI0009985F8A|nr:YtxH domain-containing protein [Bacillus alkalicellulosilyticus]